MSQFIEFVRSAFLENHVVSGIFCLSNRMKGKGINKTTIQEYCNPQDYPHLQTYSNSLDETCQLSDTVS